MGGCAGHSECGRHGPQVTDLAQDWDSRRTFLRWLAASPFLSFGLSCSPERDERSIPDADTPRAPRRRAPALQLSDVIARPQDALDVMDFEAVARQKLPPAHFGYIATGVDDDATVQANRDGYRRITIRSRRLIDVSRLDTSVHLFGTQWESPIVLSPTGSQRAFHPDGEVATARAASAKKHLMILSTVSTTSIESVNAARGTPVWYQLYPTDDWAVTRGLVLRAERSGAPALVLTVDLQDDTNRETLERSKRRDSRTCSNCHADGFAGYVRHKAMFDGLDVSHVTGLYPASFTWTRVKRLRDSTKMKLLIKGIVTRQDAELAVEHGVDGLIVSNHGGRGEETNRATVDSLSDVLTVTRGRVPVIVDGGVRRGTDIFKAIALGATAVGIGRPYLWGLAAFGQPGVEAVLSILRHELEIIMRQAGTPSLSHLSRDTVVRVVDTGPV